jgi:hypothetical protein
MTPNVSHALPTGIRVLIIVPSLLTIGFGVWHFAVPTVWNWWAAIRPQATELVLAVRAVNVLFSLLLTLHGLITIVLALRRPTERFALGLLLAASVVLWAFRVGLQVVYPQGTQIPGVAPTMLITFSTILAAYAAGLTWLLIQRHARRE